MKKFPEANCSTCGGLCRVIKQVTFSFWYCDKCKDEPRQVWLKAVTRPTEARSEYHHKSDNDIVIDKPGVYRITYTNGESEHYEHRTNASPIRIDRERVQASERYSDSDMPSRVKVQCLTEASKGEERDASLRAISNTEDSVQGSSGSPEDSLLDRLIIRDYLTLIDRSPGCWDLYVDNEGTLRDMDTGLKWLQYGEVPPDDEL